MFELDTRRKSVVVDPTGAPDEVLMEAAEACPCGAIVVEDDDGHTVAS